MDKHAYLIMAHGQFDVLKKLISVLDYELNDIYIHIDKKIGYVDEKKFIQCAKTSNVIFVDRMAISWGGESIIRCEMLLFEAAAKRGYQYYHLLSGLDFPIKTQKYIHEFFEKNDGKEFIDFWNRNEKEYLYRIKYYYPLQEKIGRYTYDIQTLFLRSMSKILVFFQKLGGVNRLQSFDGEIRGGSQWISITHEFVEYLIEQKSLIFMLFYQGIAVDELFVQTICRNSKFYDRIYKGSSIRIIDWERGNPYIWNESDFGQIKQSSGLFIRKVSGENRLLKKICEELLVE